MSSLKRRIKALEEQAQPAGGFEVVGGGRWDWTPEQLQAAIAAARERVGPTGYVLAIEYTDNWRGSHDHD